MGKCGHVAIRLACYSRDRCEISLPASSPRDVITPKGRKGTAMESIFFVMPAYNEEANIRETIASWYPVVDRLSDEGHQARLLIINDGSKDATWDVLQAEQESHPLLLPLTKANSGHGPTLIYGYTYAVGHGATFVFQTDSDGQTDPREFWQMWEARSRFDAQFGNRTARGDGKQRAFVEHTLCRILHHYYGVRVPDANAPFRLMSAEYLRKYLGRLPETYNLPNVMLTAFGAYYGDRIRFVPISFKPRQGGVNSINVKKIVRIGIDAQKDFKRFKQSM